MAPSSTHDCSALSTTQLKAIVLPFLLLMAFAAAPSIYAAQQDDDHEAAVVKAGVEFSGTPLGRKLLNFDLCGSGTAPNFNCAAILPRAKKPACCTDGLGIKNCFDVGSFLLNKCGSCTTVCTFGKICCSGVCVNLLTDNNNCGYCGHKCSGNLKCRFGLCGY